MFTKPIRFDLKKAKIKRARAGQEELHSFAMREVDGRDEEAAANMAKAKGGSATAAEEMIRLALVEVNDKPVKQPYLEFDLWNQRARAFALRAFTDLNGTTQEEAEGFLKTATEVDAPLSSGPDAASENG